jgi:protein SCO1/2
MRIIWTFVALVVLAGTTTWLGMRTLWLDLVPRRPEVSDLPDYGRVGDFSLTNQLGQAVTRSDVLGRPWVADFIFTRCSGPCPLLTFQMKRLSDSLGVSSPVRFVSFSVDPERDTAEELKRYAEVYGADHARWHFLTGERRTISDLANRSFHLAVGEPAATVLDSSGVYDIPHSLRFALVDAQGAIRGYYDGTDEAALARLHKDIALLLGKSR